MLHETKQIDYAKKYDWILSQFANIARHVQLLLVR